MDSFSLAQATVDLIANVLTRVVGGASERAGNELYSIVARHLKSRGRLQTLDAFEADVSSPRLREALAKLLTQEMNNDTDLQHSLSAIVNSTVFTDSSDRTNVVASGGSGAARYDKSVHTRVRADGSSIAAGRDINQSRTKNTNFGGLMVAAVAIATVLIVVLLGRVAYVAVSNLAGGSGLDEDSTCAEFLSSSDVQAKTGVMKELYLAREKPQIAADPFIIQNTDYQCGNRPEITLGELADLVGS